MSVVKNFCMLLGLVFAFAFLSACANMGGHNDRMRFANETPSQLGARYLLGRGVQQDDSKAFTYFMRAAMANDSLAQNEVAFMYAAGKGTARDYTKAIIWYQKAASSGLASAQYNLGLLYLYGLGTPINRELASEWIKKAAERGFQPAKQTLLKL